MIAPLRRRHRRMTAALALAVPALYVLALSGRPPEPVAETLPSALAGDPPPGEVVNEYGALFIGQAVAVRLRGGGSPWWIELEPREPVTRPEVLVYWTPETPAVADRLPADAFLLGALAGRRTLAFALPEDALGRAGQLVLYSLGHQEVVASAPLPAIGEPPAAPDPQASSGAAESGEATEEAAS